MKYNEEFGYMEPTKNYKDVGFTADKKKMAIEMLEKTLNVGAVCKHLGLKRQHFYLAMEYDPMLKEAFEEVKERHLDQVESTMYDRAKLPNGTLAGIFLLKTQRFKQFGDRTIIQHETKPRIQNLFDRLKNEGKIVDAESVIENTDQSRRNLDYSTNENSGNI